eukprot:comp23178_c0_seq1/m.37554 comp23178_c0_seq1/g.37554  ORF comp23178_c0_seq1/g.37554 comp23178_c0_seq1/m.37554 type:complete len:358 (-) comp23178_c0_seq1:240-1313(-)
MNNPLNPNGHVELQNPPTDSVSSLKFSPNPNMSYLVSTSWDNKVRVWQVDPKQGTNRHMADQQHSQPPLCSAWFPDGSKIFSGGCDKTVMQWDLNSNTFTQVAAHDAPVKTVQYISDAQVLMTGGWDKKVRYWDLRQQAPALEVLQPERVYDASVSFPLAVTALAERKIMVYDLRNPGKEQQMNTSALKFQTRCIAAFPRRPTNPGEGYALGSIEGRVSMRFVGYPEDAKDPHFSFKCHREQTQGIGRNNPKIYSVNSIAIHPLYGTFATAGSDGVFNFWDGDSKQRLKAYSQCKWSNGEPAPITCSDFSPNGAVYAYALSYDWSKGHEYYDRNIHKPTILLHGGCEVDAKPRPQQK